MLEPDTAETLIQYDGRFYRGVPAVTQNSYGQGLAYYLGTVLSRRLTIALAKQIAGQQGVPYYDGLPLGVEICTRQKGKQMWRFIFNNTEKVQKVNREDKVLTLQPFQMEIIREEISQEQQEREGVS